MKLNNHLGVPCDATWGGPAKQPTLKATITPNLTITTILGWVRKKKDGRWSWWSRVECDWFTAPGDKTREGVAASEAEAKQKLQEFWGIKETP